MKALVLEAPGAIPKLALRDVPEPELGPRDALPLHTVPGPCLCHIIHL